MTDPILVFKLVKFNKALAFQILKQDTSIFKRNDYENSNNPIEVLSVGCCDFGYSAKGGWRIYLRGKDIDNDYKIAIKQFSSNEQRDDFYGEVLSTLRCVCIEENEKALDEQRVTMNNDVFEF